MAKCGYCTHLNPDSCYADYNKKYWCSEKGEYIYADSEECWLYCKAYSRSDSVAEALIQASRESQSSSGCYLTTITCALLGMPDNNIYLKTLREFRDNVMQKDPKYFKLLAQYDIVGPVIARRLAEDPARGQIAKNLLELGIKTTVLQIKENKYDEAVQTYSTMTELLIDGCRIKREAISSEVINSMDIAKSGHGKVMLKTTPKTV